MHQTIRTIVVALLILHFVGLAFLFRQEDSKAKAREFLVSVFSYDEIMAEPPAGRAKPKVPFLVLNPSAGEQFTFEEGARISLEANKPAHWFVNNELIGAGRAVFWVPTPGRHLIHARYDAEDKMIMIVVQ